MSRHPLPSDVLARGSVRAKLMRVVLLTTALALTVSGIAMLLHELYVYRTAWASDLSTEAAIVALSSAPALAFDDHVSAERNLNALEARRRVVAAVLYAPNGTVFASFVREGEAAAPLRSPPDGLTTRGEDMELVRPVERNGEHLGTLYVRARYDLWGRIEAYSGIFALSMALSLALAFVLSKRMQESITGPLDAIAGVARAVVNGRDYSLRAAKISDDEIGVVVDAFNKMLEEVQVRTRALGEADRRKDEFLATLAHELRNPLAPIRHAVKLLESTRVEERQRLWAREVISRQVQRMALLLDDLLEVSRITRGRLDLKIEEVELEVVIRAAVETARPLIDSKQHRLRFDLPSQRVTLAADSLRLSQSLSNLLTNAAKYTDPGGLITLSVRILEEGIAMSVKDTGIGFDPKALPELFTMFSQVDSAIARSEGGLGIGLALVKGLIELHGGTIEGFSAGPGTGSEFTIHLPRSMMVERVRGERDAGAADSPPPRPDATSRLRVLIADDNRDAADSLAMLLDMNGHDVRVVHCGLDAYRVADEARPEVVLLDIGMPDLSGYEVARRIRAQPWGHAMLLVAVTGWGQKNDKERADAAGFDRHLTKPVDPDRIEKIIQEFFTGTR
jgi:signal transduction histidine kinase/CheY-like chemotaxis protein